MKTKLEKYKEEVSEWMRAHKLVPDDPDKTLDNMANKLKSLFVLFKRTQIANYRLAKEYQNDIFWKAVAIKVIDYNADPELFIDVVYRNAGAFFRPALLTGNTCWEWYNDYKDNVRLEQKIETELALSAVRYKNDVQKYKTLEEVLDHPNNGHTTLFKWCIAIKAKDKKLMAKYAKGAKDLLLRPLYRKVYTKYFPEIFKGE